MGLTEPEPRRPALRRANSHTPIHRTAALAQTATILSTVTISPPPLCLRPLGDGPDRQSVRPSPAHAGACDPQQPYLAGSPAGSPRLPAMEKPRQIARM